MRLLLVEDDDVEAEAVIRSLKKSKFLNKVVHVEDGKAALDTLRGESGFDRLDRPHLVLVDLNMPRMSGLEMLEEMRRDPQLKDTVVFVLTTSESERDREQAYQYNIAGYIVKERAGVDFYNLVQLLDDYGLVVALPA